MPSFEDVISSGMPMRPNIVVQIDDFFFSMLPVDSGLSIPQQFTGTVKSVTVPTNAVDLETANTSLPSISVTLKEINGAVNDFINLVKNYRCLNSKMTVFYGFSNAGMGFSEYKKSQDMYIYGINQSKGTYTFTGRNVYNKALKETFTITAPLASDVSLNDNNVVVSIAIDIFTDTGILKIADELIEYTTKTFNLGTGETTFTGLTRGAYTTIPSAHSEGTDAFLVQVVEDNPINVILKLLLSTGEGTNGVYDTLYDGAGIPEEYINVAQFEDIRDTYYAGETMRFFFYGVKNLVQDAIEPQLLFPNQLRFIIDILNPQLELGRFRDTILEPPDNTLTNSSIFLDSVSTPIEAEVGVLVNYAKVYWGYIEGKGFTKYFEQPLTESIDIFGRQEKSFYVYGAQSDLGGLSIALNRVNRYLAQFGYPQQYMECDVFLDKYNLSVGKIVDVDTKIVKNTDFKKRFEVLERSYSHTQGKSSLRMVSYPLVPRIAVGFIGSTGTIIDLISQTEFELDSVVLLEAGDFIRVVGTTEAREVLTVISGIVTIDSPFTTTLVLGDVLESADYSLAATQQKNKQAYISDEDNNFPDGRPPYTIMYG